MAFSGTFGLPGAAQPSNSSGQAQKGPDLEEISTDGVGFQAIAGEAKVRLLPAGWPADALPAPTSCLLAVASRKGLVAAAGPESVVVASTQAVREAYQASSPEQIKPFSAQITLHINLRVSHVVFSADEQYLLLAAETDGGLAIYSVDQLSQGQTKPAIQLQTGGGPLRAVVPNHMTEKAELVSLVTANGCLTMVNLKTQQFSNGPMAQGVSCVAWSNKGRQLIAGLGDGSCVQLTPEGETKAHIPAIPGLDNAHENDLFLIVHTPNTPSQPPASNTYHIVTRDKSSPNNLIFQFLPEPAPPFGLERTPAFQFLQRLKDFPPSLSDAIIVASTASADIGIVTRAKSPLTKDLPAAKVTNVFTLTTLAEDSRRAQLPMTATFTDTSPIGMAFDLSSRDPIRRPLPQEEYEASAGPLPGLMVLNNEGLLSMWWFVYADSIRQNTTYPGLVAATSAPPALSQSLGPSQCFGTSLGQQASPWSSSAGAKFSQPAFGATSMPGPAFGSVGGLSSRSSPWGTASPGPGQTTMTAPSGGFASFAQNTGGFMAAKPGQSIFAAPAANNSGNHENQPFVNQAPKSAFGQSASGFQLGTTFKADPTGETDQSTDNGVFGTGFASPLAPAKDAEMEVEDASASAASKEGSLQPLETESPLPPDSTSKASYHLGDSDSEAKTETGAGLQPGDSEPDAEAAKGPQLASPEAKKGTESSPKEENEVHQETPARTQQDDFAPQLGHDAGQDQAVETDASKQAAPEKSDQKQSQGRESQSAVKRSEPRADSNVSPSLENSTSPIENPRSPDQANFTPTSKSSPTPDEAESAGDATANIRSNDPEDPPSPEASQSSTPQPAASSQDAATPHRPAFSSPDSQSIHEASEQEGAGSDNDSDKDEQSGEISDEGGFEDDESKVANIKAEPLSPDADPFEAQSNPFDSPIETDARETIGSETPIDSPSESMRRKVVPPPKTSVASPSLAELRQHALAKRAEQSQELLLSDADTQVRRVLESQPEPTRMLDGFLAHQDYAGLVDKPGIPGQIEKVFRDINSMIDTLGLNARSLTAFVAGQSRTSGCRSEQTAEWTFADLQSLQNMQARTESQLRVDAVHDVDSFCDNLQSIQKEIGRLQTRSQELEQVIERGKDPVAADQMLQSPLSLDQKIQLREIRKSYAIYQAGLAETEKALSEFRAKITVLEAQDQKSSTAPTVQAVEKTITKMTAMARQKNSGMDELEAQLAGIGLSSPASRRGSVMFRSQREDSPFEGSRRESVLMRSYREGSPFGALEHNKRSSLLLSSPLRSLEKREGPEGVEDNVQQYRREAERRQGVLHAIREVLGDAKRGIKHRPLD